MRTACEAYADFVHLRLVLPVTLAVYRSHPIPGGALNSKTEQSRRSTVTQEIAAFKVDVNQRALHGHGIEDGPDAARAPHL